MTVPEWIESVSRLYVEIDRVIEGLNTLKLTKDNSTEEERTIFHSLDLSDDELYKVRSKLKWLRRRPSEDEYIIKNPNGGYYLSVTKVPVVHLLSVDVYVDDPNGGYWLWTPIEKDEIGFYFCSLGRDVPITSRKIRTRPEFLWEYDKDGELH